MGKLKLRFGLVYMLIGLLWFTSGKIYAQDIVGPIQEEAYCSALLSNNSKELKKARSIEKKILKIYDRLQKSTVDIGVPITGASGVIISEDGYILTAAHVIEALGGKDGEIRLYDGTIVTATCLGRNKNADYGLLKIMDKGKWTYADLGSSAELAKDETCIMMGHPELYDPKRSAVVRLGFYQGVTSHGYLKTSCIMMPGDSGGPLFDLNGKVIGVCSYIREGDLDENYYSPVDKVKENWDRLEFGEIFHDQMTGNSNSIIESTIENSSFALIGGKEQLKILLQQNANDLNLSQSVVKITSEIKDKETNVYGTIISAEGYIVTKSSRLGSSNLVCELNSGVTLKAVLIGRDYENDLAIIKVESQGKLAPINLDENIEIKAGQLLGTLGNKGEVLHSGIVSVNTREVPNYDKGYLGINFNSSEPIIAKVIEGEPADIGGLKEGDTFLSIDNLQIERRADVYKFLNTSKPDQMIQIKIMREDKEMELEIVLGLLIKEPSAWKKGHPAFLTKESKRKDGFPDVFTHDMPLELEECGTPVINLKGEVVGINVARKNRPSSYSVPINKVRESVQTIFDNANITVQ